MQALDHIVRSGRALYAGISNYSPQQTQQALSILHDLGTPLLIHQARYNLFDRWIEDGLTTVLDDNGVGAIVFSPLAQGFLTNKYLNGIPPGSRASREEQIHLSAEHIEQQKVAKVQQLNVIAEQREQSLAQMALAWVLHNPTVTSAIIGASQVSQIEDCVQALDNLAFSPAQLGAIAQILED
jgi:L-glyceraldehyde 3-phosphate reductase